jgi:hypothetical protein
MHNSLLSFFIYKELLCDTLKKNYNTYYNKLLMLIKIFFTH